MDGGVVASPLKKIRIVPSFAGTKDVVEIDGQDLANACRGYTLRAHVGHVPELELDLFIIAEANEVNGEVLVIVPDRTREALINLGWTPPGGNNG